MSNSIVAAVQQATKPKAQGSLEINYYRASQTTAEDLEGMCRSAATAVAADAACQAGDWAAALVAMLRLAPVEKLLLHVSRVQIFNHDLHRNFSHNLVLLGLLKKLKYWYVLPQSTFLQCFHSVASTLGVEAPALAAQAEAALASCVQLKVSVVCHEENMMCYLDNEQELEKAEPHAVCPTSEFRACDGQVLATEDASLIEGVMSTTITTTIKILTGVLDAGNLTLRNVYAPKGRCIAVVDEQVESLFGARIDTYFKTHNIPLYKLVCSGMEAGKSMQAVGTILKTLKTHSVARNEPVLVVGGGVVADLGGFATGLYDRNTPYVMLCTSIVAGIDAGLSPRTCANDFGYKNLYGAFHPPVLTLTDRTLWSTLHEGWLRHGIAEIIKMAVVKDFALFELLESVGPRLIYSKFGNMWETHQCRPHAYGHTWSPGYELPAGMLHGHAVATCMGLGAYLAFKEGFISEHEMQRIHKLISDCELTLYHPVMDDSKKVWKAHLAMVEKRGGNLCAPVPKPLGRCGYINDISKEQLELRLKEYKALCTTYPRNGLGVEPHCTDVGLEDPQSKKENPMKAEEDRFVVTPCDQAVVSLAKACACCRSDKKARANLFDAKKDHRWHRRLLCEVQHEAVS